MNFVKLFGSFAIVWRYMEIPPCSVIWHGKMSIVFNGEYYNQLEGMAIAVEKYKLCEKSRS